MKVGVVVGRFQTPYLTPGHDLVLKAAYEENDKLVVFVGSCPSNPTRKNPLSFDVRKAMIRSQYPSATIIALADRKSDEVWCQVLDECIAHVFPDPKVVKLYGSRESFLEMYTGKYVKRYVPTDIGEIRATNIRNLASKTVHDNTYYRQGIIYGVYNRFPVSYQAVDIAILKYAFNCPIEVLVGRKPHENKFRFVGGFVDVKDESLEMAAKREVMEECGGIETDAYEYIGSARIDDWRYKGSEDGLMTSFFMCDYIFGHAKPTDDISELSLIRIEDVKEENFEPEHAVLVRLFNKTMKTKTK